ncbi:response regulator [Flagellimonas nanhaiensis]|uniref:DNA-binding response regulator n=1 Tax=Flagellimonas nanhaiensis TaxID=2292706 RepID=A0A371JP59_9FLAO|nr:response regulator transcription factor [Allomuricauda nanhaiensis]RDY59271.1 DNA-binding response regulator [Allomuricauda nanhaiensis]
MKINVVLVDDNVFLIRTIQEKLSFFPSIQIKYSANSGEELLEKLKKDTAIHLILMDIEMPNMNGIEVTEKVKQKYPHIKIIMLTVFDDDESIFKAIQAGADGYLLKEIDPTRLYNGILETFGGGAAMNPSIAKKTLNLLRNPEVELKKEKSDVTLSLREVQVLEQLATGISYVQIAENLFISPATVRKHIENIYKKLQVHNKLEAVQKAKRDRLI